VIVFRLGLFWIFLAFFFFGEVLNGGIWRLLFLLLD
jgi:hypothetical protein